MRMTPPPGARRTILILLCAGLASCVAPAPPRTPPPTPPPAAPADTLAPADFPESFYRQSKVAGKTVLRVNPAQSLVTIEVRRGGPLARLGHDHVVASHDVRGYVLPAEGRADLYLPLARLAVDEPVLRAEAGFDTQPSRDAIDGTRRNMLEKVLETGRFPFALIRAERKDAASATLKVSISLHGQTRIYDGPVRIDTLPGKMIVDGRMAIAQSDFGITPFSVLGGALQVQDRLEMRYRIVAEDG